MTEMVALDVRIAPDRIHFLKFILEGYDGLAMLSTVEPRIGHARLRFSAAAEKEVRALLHNLGPQLGLLEYL